MIKKVSVIVSVLCLMFITLGVNLNAVETGDNTVKAASGCVETKLSIDKESVYGNGQIKVTLKYYSVQPSCSAEELAGQRIEIDLSNVIDIPLSTAIQSSLEETDHYIPTIEGDVLVLTFKDISSLLGEGEGLEDFWGSVSFVVQVKSVTEDTNESINDNVTGSADIDILAPSETGGGGIANTQKWPEKDYVEQGDYLKYTIRLNNEWKYHDSIHMEDTIPRGMSLVIGDPDHPIDMYRATSTTNPWPDEGYGDISSQFNIDASPSKLTIDSTAPVDYGISIHYWVHVDSEVSSGEYTNLVKAVYDDKSENTDYTVELNGGGDTGEVGAGGYIDLNKADQFDHPVAGAVFKISDGTKTVATLTTNESGYAISEKLPCGEYMVRETTAPDGYELNTEKFFVDIEINNEVVTVNDGNFVIDNVSMGNVELNKVDQDEVPLAGAEFTIYDQAGEVVSVLTTDSKGNAVSEDLLYGDYTVKETKAPDGYRLDNKVYDVTVDTSDSNILVNDGNPIVNYLKVGNIELQKVDELNNPVAGAVFTIYDNKGVAVSTMTSQEDGRAVSEDLPLGLYTVVETEAPDGYSSTGLEYQAKISRDGQTVKLNDGNPIINIKTQGPDISIPMFTIDTGNVELNKVDQDGVPLAGVEFTIYDESNIEVEKMVTDKDGYAKSGKLQLGNYYVRETKALDGYLQTNEKYSFSIENDGDLVTVNNGNPIVNTKDVEEIGITDLVPSDPIEEATSEVSSETNSEIKEVNDGNETLATKQVENKDQTPKETKKDSKEEPKNYLAITGKTDILVSIIIILIGLLILKLAYMNLK